MRFFCDFFAFLLESRCDFFAIFLRFFWKVDGKNGKKGGRSETPTRGDASKGQPARCQLELDTTLVSSGGILLPDYKMFLTLVQVHPFKEERSRRKST